MSTIYDAGDGFEFLEALRRQGVAEKRSLNEFADFLEGKARREGIPINGQFELSPLCNLDCGMCYVHRTKGQLDGRRLMDVGQWKELCRQAFEAGMYRAALTGGECLLYPGFEELYLYLHSLGCQVDVLTNGVLLNDEKMDFFRLHPPSLIQVTLYGDSEDTYERVTGHRVFHNVVDHLRRVREEGFPLIITVTPTLALGESVFETIRLARSITKNVFVNTSLFDPPDGLRSNAAACEPDVEFYARVLRFLKELNGTQIKERPESDLPLPGGPCQGCAERGLRCGGGRSGFVIDWQGKMKICSRLAPESDPLRDGFQAAWNSIHEAAVNWPAAPECRGCAYEEICGICAADALKYGEPGKQPKALCERTRYLASRGVLPSTCPE